MHDFFYSVRNYYLGKDVMYKGLDVDVIVFYNIA